MITKKLKSWAASGAIAVTCMFLSGCKTTQTTPATAANDATETYTPTGSNMIKRKKKPDPHNEAVTNKAMNDMGREVERQEAIAREATSGPK